MTVALKKPPRSARKPKGDGHMRRGEILAAAEKIFIAEGYAGATIRKIADAVGVSSTALYMHFRDKDQILLEIGKEAIEQLLSINVALSQEPIDAVEKVRRMLDAYMRFAFENPNTYQLVFCGSNEAISVEKQQAVSDLGDRCFDEFSGPIREIAAAGRLKTGTAESAAQVLWAACHGIVSLVITKPSRNWAPAEELMQVTLDGVMHGLIADR
ncbi:TetR/AcrR family transcriptional regulator [Caulobacter flavus]|uniref:TetR/AcrR family transcriptional regulator n=1 Tax=Caulobacter flavus TaxID=1679497 RepID=A0A2N5CLL1_9CAUL|nr:TetR/AcrR family transcriptional regulator [Caulobacter flavus]AYV48862.1 TetR/AcrR family transcriptional regulator [Caulobacter flavus]PLR06680.1 TetR/AcrR family transcriptional regulator [Caulobacter flavus]